VPTASSPADARTTPGSIRVAIAAAVIVIALLAPSPAGAAKGPRDFYGVVPQGGLRASDFERLGNARVSAIRVEFDWAAVQGGRGQCRADGSGPCNWAGIDSLVANAAAAGIRIFPTLYGAPRFVNKHHNDAPAGGKDLAGWRDFVAAAAGRYGRGGVFWRGGRGYGTGGPEKPITDWQIWNEPNSKQFWHGRPQPRRYGRMVRTSAEAIRNHDPNAEIVLAGMFGFAKRPLASFLRELYKMKRIERSFDALAIHPYSPKIAGIKRQIGIARGAARRAGDRKVGIHMTELGWSSGSGRHELEKGKKGQAALLRKSFRMLRKRRGAWNIESVIWFAYNDTKLETCTFCRNAGLVNANREPKPAWRAFVRFTK